MFAKQQQQLLSPAHAVRCGDLISQQIFWKQNLPAHAFELLRLQKKGKMNSLPLVSAEQREKKQNTNDAFPSFFSIHSSVSPRASTCRSDDRGHPPPCCTHLHKLRCVYTQASLSCWDTRVISKVCNRFVCLAEEAVSHSICENTSETLLSLLSSAALSSNLGQFVNSDPSQRKVLHTGPLITQTIPFLKMNKCTGRANNAQLMYFEKQSVVQIVH